MRVKSIAVATLASLAVAFLAGCGPTKKPNAGGQQPTATPAAAASPTPTIKDLPIGNCTLYPKTEAVKLIGAVNVNNKALDIATEGGTKIDVCSYIHFNVPSLQGTTYAVVRYDDAATAFAKAQKLRTEMLGSAADNNWDVKSLTTPAPGAGPVLGGFATKNDNGLTYTIAVIGTNIGPYLVAALGASTDSPDNAKKFAIAVFQALSAAVA